MLTNIFIAWIAFQLIIIGIAGISIHNDVINKTYKCPTGEFSIWIGVAVPLVMFAPDIKEARQYCEIINNKE